MSVFKKRTHVPGGPGIYSIHGGGMVLGDRLSGVDMALEWVQRFDAVAVSVEYRLAPEHPNPAPVRDCYAGLAWTAAHAMDLGFDPERLIIVGASAGGGLAAGTTLMAREGRSSSGRTDASVPHARQPRPDGLQSSDRRHRLVGPPQQRCRLGRLARRP